jgi:hypothetical protein
MGLREALCTIIAALLLRMTPAAPQRTACRFCRE